MIIVNVKTSPTFLNCYFLMFCVTEARNNYKIIMLLSLLGQFKFIASVNVFDIYVYVIMQRTAVQPSKTNIQ